MKEKRFLNKILTSPFLTALLTLALLFLVFAKNLYIPPAIAGFLWGMNNEKIMDFKNFLKFFAAYFLPLIIFAMFISIISWFFSGYYSEFTYGIKYIVILANVYCILIFFGANILACLICKLFTKNKFLNIIPKSIKYLINNPLKFFIVILLCTGTAFLAKDICQSKTMLKGDFELIQNTKHPSTIKALIYNDNQIIRFSPNNHLVNFELIDIKSKKILKDKLLNLEILDGYLYTTFIDENKILIIAAKSSTGYKNGRNVPKYFSAGILDINNCNFERINKIFDYGKNHNYAIASAENNSAVLVNTDEVYLFETENGMYKSFNKIMNLKEVHRKPEIIKIGQNQFIICSSKNIDENETFLNIELIDIKNKTSKVVYTKNITKLNKDTFEDEFKLYKHKNKYFILISDNNERSSKSTSRYLITVDKNFKEIKTKEIDLGKFFNKKDIVQLKSGNFLIFHSWIRPDKDPKRMYIYNIETNKFYPVKKKLNVGQSSHIETLLLNNGNILLFSCNFNENYEKIKLFKPDNY